MEPKTSKISTKSRNMPCKVYVIIVTFNGVKWIDRCLDSLRKSDYPVQVIVIDNGSTDGTVERIKQYKNVELIESDKNLGFGIANNIGIKKALEYDSDYLFLLNQDAWIEPKTIEVLVRIAENNRDFGILSPVHLNGEGSALDYQFSTYIDPDQCPGFISDVYLDNHKEVYTSNSVNAAAWLVRKRVFEDVGLFDEMFFMYGEDDNLIDRAKHHGYKIGISPNTIIYHDREHRPRKKGNIRKNYRQQINRMKVIALNPGFSTADKIFLLFRKSMSDFIRNVKSLHILPGVKNIAVLFYGIYYSVRYKNRHVELSKQIQTLSDARP